MKGQLPKAYLRLDPLIDSHPDWAAMVTLVLWANRQPRRGYFKTLEVIRKLIGRRRLDACIARRDLAEQPDGTYYLLGWDDWQEGDFTVGERMRRYRNKHVTGTVTNAVTLPSPPSEAARQQGSKAVETEKQRAVSIADSEKPPDGNSHGVPEDQRQEYAAEVWAEFLRVSGQRSTRMATAVEFDVLKRWMDAGVPLRIVLRGMADCVGKGARSLAYFAPAVSDAVEKQRQAVPL